MEVSSQLHSPAALPPEKSPQNPLDKMLRDLADNRMPVVQSVVWLLYWLSYTDYGLAGPELKVIAPSWLMTQPSAMWGTTSCGIPH